MTTWLPILPAVLVAILLFYLPGLVVTAGWKLPAFWRLGLAPVMTMLILAVSGFSAWLSKSHWSIVWVLGIAVILGGIAWGLAVLGNRTRVGKLWLMREPDNSPGLRVVGQYALGLIIPAMLFMPKYLSAFGTPAHFLQRFDNAFHLNAIAWIRNTGEAASPQLEFMVNSKIYPLGWHQFNALAETLSGVTLTGTVFATYLVVMFIVWPISASLLAESSLKMTIPVRILTPAISLSFMAFPHMTVEAGGIYANYFGLSVAPVLLALLIQLAQISEVQQLNIWTALVLGLVGALGLAWAHPNATMFIAAAAVPLVGISVWEKFRNADQKPDGLIEISHRVWLAVAIIYIVGLAGAWILLAPGLEVSPWQAFASIPQTLGEAVFVTTMSKPAIWAGSFLSIIGLFVVLRRRRDLGWVLGPYLVAVGLYLVSAAFGPSQIRNLITGVFYNDARRTGSALSIGALLIAVIAARVVVDWLGKKVAHKWRYTRHLWQLPTALGLALSLIFAGSMTVTRGFVYSINNQQQSYKWQTSEDFAILSRVELAVLKEAAKRVPQGEVIANNPLDGSGLMYSLTSSTPLNYYMFQKPTPQVDYLNKRLRRAATDPKVCEIVRELNVTHVVVLDDHMIGGYDARDDYPGMFIYPFTKGFELEFQIGTSRLYRITACS